MGKKRKKKKGKKMGKSYIYKQPPASDNWEVDLKVIENCSEAPESIIVWVDPIAKVKIDALMDEYPNIEWLAYLIGEGNNVSDIFVPDQLVTQVSVTNIDCPEFNELNCIGVIHSHHGMGNGFSGTDHAWINQNHNISLCISKNGIAGQVRWKTPCGSMKIVKSITKLKLDVDFKKEEFVEAVKSKIGEQPIRPSVTTVRGSPVHGVSGSPIVYGQGYPSSWDGRTLQDEDWDVEDDLDTGHPVGVEELDFDKELTLEEELLILEHGVVPTGEE